MMHSCDSSSSSSVSLSLSLSLSSSSMPSPKSPPIYPDLYGNRRQLIRVQILEREIGSLQDELKSLESLQPASRCCKEIDDFMGGKPDPLTMRSRRKRKRNPWKRFWRKHFCKIPCFFCCCACLPCPKMPNRCSCSCKHKDSCFGESSCKVCCGCPVVSCPCCTCCCGSVSCFPSCTKVNLCCNGTQACCQS